jgi:CheY-like chemotaxis protein
MLQIAARLLFPCHALVQGDHFRQYASIIRETCFSCAAMQYRSEETLSAHHGNSMMTQKTVLSAGQCGPDHASLVRFLVRNFDVQIIATDLPADTLETLRSQTIDLVLINRRLDADNTDGMDILKTLKNDGKLARVPVMIVSNFKDAQHAAVQAGAIRGFGKAELSSPVVRERLAEILSD